MRGRLFLPWVALSVGCLVWMWLVPGGEVVPFHLIWIGFALAYGFEAWALAPTVVALLAATVTSGSILVLRAATGVIAWEETTEILLMLLLAVLVVWHVQRRQAALATVTLMADREAAVAAQRVRLARLTSHEMRTPLTIAQGYAELILARQLDPGVREEVEVVHDELGRLGRASDRLLRMITVGAPLPRTDVDVDALLHQTADRWSTVATREWIVEADGGTVDASAERLRACLDTLIENAVRHTVEGDVVLLHGSRTQDRFYLGVADSGPGLDTALAAAINTRHPHAAHLVAGDGQGQSSRTGLGIALVEEIVEPRGGRVLVGRSHHGGALVLLVLPTEVPDLKAPGSEPSVEASTWAALSPDPPPRTGADRRNKGVDPHPG